MKEELSCLGDNFLIKKILNFICVMPNKIITKGGEKTPHAVLKINTKLI